MDWSRQRIASSRLLSAKQASIQSQDTDTICDSTVCHPEAFKLDHEKTSVVLHEGSDEQMKLPRHVVTIMVIPKVIHSGKMQHGVDSAFSDNSYLYFVWKVKEFLIQHVVLHILHRYSVNQNHNSHLVCSWSCWQYSQWVDLTWFLLNPFLVWSYLENVRLPYCACKAMLDWTAVSSCSERSFSQSARLNLLDAESRLLS